MKVAKLFSNGRSQAVRLPKDCSFKRGEKEVYVHKFEGMVMLISKKNPWSSLLKSLTKFPDDYMEDRSQPMTSDSRKSLE